MTRNSWSGGLLILVFLLLTPNRALGHCDGVDGPVVKAAEKALESGNVKLVLVWVQKADEAEIEKAFEQTVFMRKLGPEARALADTYFFETLVRLHRAGEGASYTGLKPAGRDLGPAIPAADKALEDRNVEPLLKIINRTTEKGLREHFREALEKADFNKDDVGAGRAYIRAYVEFIHYAERSYEAAAKPVSGHYEEGAAGGRHEE